MKRLLGINGSLRRGSYNGALLELASSVCPAGVKFTRWHGLADIPAYNEDLESSPPLGVIAFRAQLARADAVLFATPEYNTSIPGALKNALDWASRPVSESPLRNKPTAVIGASQGAFVGYGRRQSYGRFLLRSARSSTRAGWLSVERTRLSHPTGSFATRTFPAR